MYGMEEDDDSELDERFVDADWLADEDDPDWDDGDEDEDEDEAIDEDEDDWL